MVQNIQNFLEIHQMKSCLELYLFYSNAGIELPSKIPINILPASSLM